MEIQCIKLIHYSSLKRTKKGTPSMCNLPCTGKIFKYAVLCFNQNTSKNDIYMQYCI